MSEKALQEGIQAVIQSLPEFREADVTINDWSLLDGPTLHAPYVVIENSDDPDSVQDSMSEETTWTIPVNLIEAMKGWEETLNNFRDRRQAILDKFNAVGTARSAGGIEATTIDRVYALGPIGYLYPKGISPEEMIEATPEYIMQTIGFECKEF